MQAAQAKDEGAQTWMKNSNRTCPPLNATRRNPENFSQTGPENKQNLKSHLQKGRTGPHSLNSSLLDSLYSCQWLAGNTLQTVCKPSITFLCLSTAPPQALSKVCGLSMAPQRVKIDWPCDSEGGQTALLWKQVSFNSTVLHSQPKPHICLEPARSEPHLTSQEQRTGTGLAPHVPFLAKSFPTFVMNWQRVHGTSFLDIVCGRKKSPKEWPGECGGLGM